MNRGNRAALVAALIALGAAAPAHAVTLAVDKTADDAGAGACTAAPGDCSLRSAIARSNALATDDLVQLSSLTYDVGSAMSVVDDVTIDGTGARQTVIDANGATATVLNINSGGRVVVQDLQIREAAAADANDTSPVVAITTVNSLILERIALVDNTAIPVLQTGGTFVSLLSSTIARNSAPGVGGVGSTGTTGAMTIRSSTIADNVGKAGTAAPIAYAGGVLSTCQASITDSTIVRNRTDSPNAFGGNVAAVDAGSSCGAEMRLSNSLVAGGKAGNVPNDCGSDVVSMGGNMDSDGSCGFGRTAADPKLGPVANNGGPTDTVALLEGSPAIDAGTGCLSSDQRGTARPAGGGCDIGAFESPFTAPPPPPPVAPAAPAAPAAPPPPAAPAPPAAPVAATAAPADTTAPKLTVKGIDKTVRRSALRRGLAVKVGAGEAVAVEATMLVAPRTVRIAAVAPDLQLAAGSLKLGAGERTVTLKPKRRVTGRRAVRALVRIVAYDAAGNRASRTVSFTIR